MNELAIHLRTFGRHPPASRMLNTSMAEVEAAMRTDFWSMPTRAREHMLELLGASGCETRAWWEDLLGVTSTSPQRAVS